MRKILFGLLFVLSLSSFAQGYKHFTIEQGLPSNRTYEILQDYDGFIWIATDQGLSKFDGTTFKKFSTSDGLPSNDIWQILLTKDNKLWYFTRSNEFGYIRHDSIFSFKAKNDEFLYPTTISTNLKEITFRSYIHNYKLIENKWETLNGYSIKEKVNMPFKLLHPQIDHLLLKKSEKVQTIELISKHPKKNYKTLKIGNYLHLNGQINDSLVVITLNNGLALINLNEPKLHRIINSKLFSNNVFMRVINTENNIQISSKNFWAEIDNQYRLKNRHYFSPKIGLTNLYQDRQGNFWGTTNAQGIYFFPKNSLSRKNYLSNQPVQFLKLMHNQLFAAVLDKGIYKYSPQKNKFELFFKNNDYFFDMHYKDDANFGIFANSATIIKQKGKLHHYERIGKGVLAFNDYFAIREMGTISIYNNDLELIKTYKLDGSNDLIYYKKHLFAGTPLGLFRNNAQGFEKIPISHLTKFPILSLGQIQNYLIIGTDGKGAYLWDDNKSFKLFPKTENLIISNIVTKENIVWLSTSRGVFEYTLVNGQPIFNKILRKTDGLISDHVNHLVLFKNKLFTSNLSGIASVNIKEITASVPPKIYFKKITYNQQSLNKQQNTTYFQKNNNLNIDFGVIDYFGQEHNQYYYELLPVQKKWQAIPSNNVNFNSLAPNEYTFKVKVINPYGQVQTASFPFTIKPRWWQTNWAKFLMVFLSLSTIFVIGYLIRRKELNKQRQKLLAQKQMAEFELHALRSQMNPHFVFNSLNAIQYYINDENYDKSEAYLVRFARLIRMIFEFSRKKTIKLKQEINLLQSYLNLEKMRFGDNFNHCLKIDPKLDIDQIEIPTLLLQPIVENAVNHGIFHKKGKGTICLAFNYIKPKTFEVIIQDDGVGIEKSKAINKASLKKHQSRSTEILKDRIKLLNLSGKWQIDYQFTDATNDKQTPYNTIVKLKITKK